ncbi:MAG TPA: glycosyltransferase family 4 protein [Hyphomicrobiaceae bacterium]|nr:glycosyltransferase family 4 protein [Hyphomicrobiaceae bacterium]
MTGLIAVVLKGYPRLSETFIAQELRGLEQAGYRLAIFSLRQPTDPAQHSIHAEIAAPVVYLPEYLYREPLRVLRSFLKARRSPGFAGAVRVWLRDLLRDPTPNRVRRFGQALVMTAELPCDARWLYAHFIHTPSAVTRYASLMTRVPWSCSAHAKDIWTSPDWELRANMAAARWVTTCTGAGRDHLVRHTDDANKVRLIHHGLDLARFPSHARSEVARDGSEPSRPVRLLTVGRAVEKKGLDVLLDALALLPGGRYWTLTHIGGGEKLAKLKTQAQRLALADRVRWLGARPQHEVLAAYRASDIFVLPCRVARDGDRDGIPNVLMEAQSQGLACISTGVSAVPELIMNGETGLLVAPEDRVALAKAIARLMADPALRERLAAAGQRHVRQSFDSSAGLVMLSELFRQSLEAEALRAKVPVAV